jgi:hypothetical protein
MYFYFGFDEICMIETRMKRMLRIKTDFLYPFYQFKSAQSAFLSKAIVFTAANITTLAPLPVKCYTFRKSKTILP